MEEAGESEVIDTTHMDGHVYYSSETVAGDVFSVVRPEVDPDTEKALREWQLGLVEDWVDDP